MLLMMRILSGIIISNAIKCCTSKYSSLVMTMTLDTFTNSYITLHCLFVFLYIEMPVISGASSSGSVMVQVKVTVYTCVYLLAPALCRLLYTSVYLSSPTLC